MKQTKLQREALVAPQSTNANKHKSAELSAGIMKLADECTPKYLLFFRGAVTARSFGSQRQQRRPVDLSRELASGDRQKAIRSRRCKKTNQQQSDFQGESGSGAPIITRWTLP